MAVLKNHRHEVLARGSSAAAAYVEARCKANALPKNIAEYAVRWGFNVTETMPAIAAQQLPSIGK
jgi:hypothetical protein